MSYILYFGTAGKYGVLVKSANMCHFPFTLPPAGQQQSQHSDQP